MSLNKWQAKFLFGAAAVLPIAPFLYVQSRITRWKIGVLPPAEGPHGVVGEGEDEKKLLVLGESTVAGLGARTHDLALGGQFASRLSEKIGSRVRWTVVGKNGVTAHRTLVDLWPLVPDERFDYILLGVGGNDVLKISSPKKWRSTMLKLLRTVREANPDAVIFITNCPMIKFSPVLPEPIKGILWRLSTMHDENIREFTRGMDRVYYYPQPVDNDDWEGFWADGIHPSERGYHDWAKGMIDHFSTLHRW